MPVVMCALLVSSQAAQAPALRWSSCIIWFVVKIIIIVGMGIFMTALRIKKNTIKFSIKDLTLLSQCIACFVTDDVNFPLSTCRFFKPRSPLFHTTMKCKGNIALNNKGTWIAHFFNFARKKIVYTRLTTLYWSIRNSSAQLTSARVVLYIVARRPFWQVIHF